MPWGWALFVALVMQAISAFLTRVFPVLGPALTDAAGVPPEQIGHLASLGSLGTMLFLVAGTALLKRFGAARLLQMGAVLGGAALLLGLGAFWPALLLSALLIGVGYGPSPPAGSDLLARYAPKGRRSLVFSIKQAGVPLGGVVAGLLLPPLALIAGVEAALVAGAAIAILAALAVQPLRGRIDADRDRAAAVSVATLFSPQNLTAPFRVLRDRRLAVFTYVGFCFAVAQGALLTVLVTFLTTDVGLGLALAGGIFAVTQVAGTVSRVAVGWVADRIGSARVTLALLALSSSILMATVAAIDAGWPTAAIVAVSAVSGLAVTSWNGVYLAEVATLAPPDRVGEATSGSTFCTFIGYVVSPTLFAAIVAATGSYPGAFLLTAALPLTAALALMKRT